MKQKINYLTTLIFTILLIITQNSCSDMLQDMHIAYNEGRYLEASQKAIEGIKDPNLKPEIEKFMSEKGAQIIEKAIYKGILLEKNPKEDTAIIYYQSLIHVIEQMALLDFNITNLSESIKIVNDRLLAVILIYIDQQYQYGLFAMKKKLYRQSLIHFNNINKYKSNYKKTHYFIRESYSRAKRQISITPFFKRADIVSEIFHSKEYPTILKAPLVIEGLDIPNLLTAKLYDDFNEKKSIFLQFSIDKPEDNIENSHYYIEGEINVKISDTIENPLKENISDILQFSKIEDGQMVWHERSFKYERLTCEYKVIISIDSTLYLTQNDKKVHRITFDRRIKETSSYRSIPSYLPKEAREIRYPSAYLNLPRFYRPINKIEVIKKVINKASNDFTEEILKIIEKDLDAYAQIPISSQE